MFKWNRVLVALIGIPLLIFVYVDKKFMGIPLLIFTNLIVGLGTYEFYKMVKFSKRQVYTKYGILVSLIIPNIIYLHNIKVLKSDWTLNILIFSVILMFIYRVIKNEILKTLEVTSLTLMGIIYVSVLFSQIINIYFLTKSNEKLYFILLAIQILVWVSDTFAGIIGVSIGRKIFKKGFTEISPKKSIEGALGSIFFSGLAGVIIARFLFLENINLNSLLLFFVVGSFISIISQLGDLIESLIKRECGVKDSGTILMGHGGILDRFDSLIIVIPIVYLIMSFN